MQQISHSMADAESLNGKLKIELEAANTLVTKKERMIAFQQQDNIIKMRKHIARATKSFHFAVEI